jgi:hypothetical protein
MEILDFVQKKKINKENLDLQLQSLIDIYQNHLESEKSLVNAIM